MNLSVLRNRLMLFYSRLTSSNAIRFGIIWSSKLTVKVSNSMLTVPPIQTSYGLSPGN